jgi:hypothetical protein
VPAFPLFLELFSSSLAYSEFNFPSFSFFLASSLRVAATAKTLLAIIRSFSADFLRSVAFSMAAFLSVSSYVRLALFKA